MESLFGKNDAPLFRCEAQLRPLHEGDELLDILESDARGVSGVRGGFIVPGAAIKKIFRIGMECEMPIEITTFFGALREILDKGTSGESLSLIAAGVMNVPVVLEGNVNSSVGGMFAHGGMAGADRAQIIVRELFHGSPAHVGPEPMRIDFISDDVIPDAPV